MEIGIIGLPNVGKSTLFNALTSAGVPAENFPFTTIEPNIGMAVLKDTRLAKLGKLFSPEKLTPVTVKFVDIAGIVKGASKGEGLGNKFLSHIREMDALLQVVRAFADDKVVNTMQSFDPVAEIETVELEMVLSDLEYVIRMREKLSGLAKCGNKEAKEQLASLDRIKEHLDANKPLREKPELAADFRDFNSLTSKAVLYLFNVTDKTPEDTLKKLTGHTKIKPQTGSISVNVQMEYELTQLSEEEKVQFRSEMGDSADLDALVRKAYEVLGLITFYTVVGKEIRAWSIPKGTPAKKAAGNIHTDMEQGFIRAEVYPFTTLQEHGSEKALRDKGLVRSEGKEYIVADGDVVKFLFNN